MLVRGITRRVDIPHEEGQWVELRSLSWKEIRKARDSRQTEVIEKAKSFGKDLMDQFRGVDIEDIKDAPEATDPLNDYDIEILLLAGIVAWSYDEEPGEESIQYLDEETAEFIARQLIPAKRPEEEQKKDS